MCPFGIFLDKNKYLNRDRMIALLWTIRDKFAFSVLFTSSPQRYGDIFKPEFTFAIDRDSVSNLKKVRLVVQYLKNAHPNGINGQPIESLIVIDTQGSGDDSILRSFEFNEMINNINYDRVTAFLAVQNYHALSAPVKDNYDFLVA